MGHSKREILSNAHVRELHITMNQVFFCIFGNRFSLCLGVFGAAIKSVNTGAVIGDKLDNQIFGLSQLEPWKNQNSPIMVFKVFTEFILSFATYATACAYGL